MSGLIDKRKRSREDDVLCDSTPLAKRINNLHLTNPNSNDNHNLEQILHVPSKYPLVGVSADQYEPELTETQNPFYYLKNKLLHELHLERLKRCSI